MADTFRHDFADVSDVVLYSTLNAHAALNGAKLEGAQRSLLDRIDGFRSIEQMLAMYGDLIVKLQEHFTATGKANPGMFLDRLTDGLAMARKKSSGGQRAAVR